MISDSTFKTKQVVVLAVGHFAVDFYAGFLPPLIPILQKSLMISLSEAAFLVSVFSVSTTFSQTIFGYIFDRWHQTSLLVLAPLLAGISMTSLGLMNSYGSLLIILIFGGISIAAFHPLGAALVAVGSGRRHSVGMSIFVTGGTVGVATGSLIVSFLIERSGITGPIYAGFFGVLVSVMIWWMFDHSNPSKIEIQSSSDLSLNKERYKDLLIFGVLAMTRAFVVLGTLTFVPFFILKQTESLQAVGLILFVFGLTGGIGGFAAGKIVEKIGEKTVLLASFLLPVPLFAVFLVLGNSVIGIASLGLAGYWLYSGVPVLISLSQRKFPKRVGLISSVVMGISWGVAGLLITPAGLLAEKIGLSYTLWSLNIVAFGGFLLVLIFFRSSWLAGRSIAG